MFNATHKGRYVTLRQGDPSFQMADNFTVVDRASLEISVTCPKAIISDLNWAIQQGHIKLVAHVPKNDPTLIWETLQQ
jgi:hypothetical protein